MSRQKQKETLPKPRKVINAANYVRPQGTLNTGSSMTIQDDAPSLATMVRRHIIADEREFVNADDEYNLDLEKINAGDLADREEILGHMKKAHERLRAQHEKDLKAAQEARKRKEEAHTLTVQQYKARMKARQEAREELERDKKRST